MKILTIVESKHQGNTLKVAKAMAREVPMTITDVKGASNYNLDDYDILGFGSGLYYGRYDKELTRFAKAINDKPRAAFVLFTSGINAYSEKTDPLVNLLKRKNKNVLGLFGCRGHDKFIVFRIVGGLNKGHPDEADLKNARDFISGVAESYENAKKRKGLQLWTAYSAK